MIVGLPAAAARADLRPALSETCTVVACLKNALANGDCQIHSGKAGTTVGANVG